VIKGGELRSKDLESRVRIQTNPYRWWQAVFASSPYGPSFWP